MYSKKHIDSSAIKWKSTQDVPNLHKDSIVHIWHSALTATQQEIDYYQAFLSKDEMERSLKFYFKKDKNQFIKTRGILRNLLSKYTQSHPRNIRFKYNKYGKPYLANLSTISFNVSHSADHGLFAFASDKEIGIDLEKINPQIEVKKLAARFFSKEEAKIILALPSSKQAIHFFKCWTRKEAFIKGHGEGLSLPLDQFEVTILEEEDVKLKKVNWNTEEAKFWNLASFSLDKEMLGALAFRGNISKIKFMNWKFDPII